MQRAKTSARCTSRKAETDIAVAQAWSKTPIIGLSWVLDELSTASSYSTATEKRKEREGSSMEAVRRGPALQIDVRYVCKVPFYSTNGR